MNVRTGSGAASGAVLTAVRARQVAFVLLAVGLLYAPFFFRPFHVFQLTQILAFAVALLGLNLLVGYAGQISLGHGAFFAVGAYGSAILIDRFDVPHLATAPLVALVAFGLGYAFGLPALRLHGLYLALVTLSLAVITPPLLKRFEPVTGGSMGLTVDKPEAPAWTGLADDQWVYLLALAVAAIAFLAGRNLLRSRVGRALLASRDHAIAAEVMGVPLSKYKTLVFAWSAMYAGVGGAVFTWVIGFVAPDSFPIALSISLLSGVVVGGLASLAGALYGAAFVVLVPSVAQDINEAAPGVVFGALLIIAMYVAPTGIAGLVGRVGARLATVLGGRGRPSSTDPSASPSPAEPDRGEPASASSKPGG